MDRHKLASRTLIYDRECEICCWARDLVSRWDRRRRIRYVAFQDPLFKERFPDYDLEVPPKAMLFIDEQGRVWEGFDAFRKMLRCLPGGKLIAMFFCLPGIPWVAHRFYEWLAKNRYRFRSNS